jgi:ATP adenylyltransferase
MERLWAPWRAKYIDSIDTEANSGCIFCDMQGEDDEDSLILHRSEHCFVVMNLYPYNNGHLMVIPYRHVADLSELSDEEKSELLSLASKVMKAIREVMRAEGFNLGINLGRVAGAGVEGHIHLHVVPRWNGDTNFMPVIGKTNVISESFKSTYDKLKKYWEEAISVKKEGDLR